MCGVEFGSIAELFAAVGTVGALLWGVWLYRRSVADQERDQVDKVHVVPISGYRFTHSAPVRANLSYELWNGLSRPR